MSGNLCVKKLTTLIVIGALLMCAHVPYAQAQDEKPIVISFGQPNIWSLEQAHYLLNRLRARSLGIRTIDLNSLDPNEVHGTRLDVLKTLISGGVGFNQAVGLNNELFEKNSRFNLQRRQDLLTRRDAMQAQQFNIVEELARLRNERERMNGSAFTDAQRAQKDVEITERTKVKDLLAANIEATTTEINGLPAAPEAAQTPTPPEPSTSSKIESITDKLLDDEDFKKNLSALPKLNATTKLDNDINLQYEIIAKQLTLLREEIGRGQRLVFLELPQTFYTVPSKSNRKLAQVWWRIEEFTKRTGETQKAVPTTPPTAHCGADPNAWKKAVENNPFAPPEANRTQFDILTDTQNTQRYILREQPQQKNQKDKRQKELNQDEAQRKSEERMTQYLLVSQNEVKDERIRAENKARVQAETKAPIQAESEARALDLIPRQSALNVNDIQDREKNFNIMGVFTLLSGLGARVNYERQRRLYEQFIGQEIYASAFGKGLTDFGWTFGPLPGTERIATGLHTTYAVLVIPADAETVTLKARGCYFSRTDYAPSEFPDRDEKKCTAPKTFKMLVPGTSENNFWVTAVNFKPVKPGDFAVVHIHGEYFSPQVGVLVDGVPLRHEIGLAQIELSLGRSTHDALYDPAGGFEFVNSKQLVLVFKKDKNYRGTPSITLVSPGRSREINRLRLVINGSYRDKAKGPSCYKAPGIDESIYVTLDEIEDKMFSPEVPFVLTGVDVVDSTTSTIKAQLTGTGFVQNAVVYINGRESDKVQLVTSGVLLVDFKPPNRDSWNVTVVQSDEDERVSATLPIPNPLALKVTRSEIVSYEAAVKDKPKKPGKLMARLQGAGFSSLLVVTLRRVTGPVMLFPTIVSPTEMIIEITAPNEIEIVDLRNPITGASSGTTIVRPPPGS